MGEVFHPEQMVSVGGVEKGLNTGVFGGCPSNPLFKATQLSLFVYDSRSLQATVPPVEPNVSACNILCAGP